MIHEINLFFGIIFLVQYQMTGSRDEFGEFLSSLVVKSLSCRTYTSFGCNNSCIQTLFTVVEVVKKHLSRILLSFFEISSDFFCK